MHVNFRKTAAVVALLTVAACTDKQQGKADSIADSTAGRLDNDSSTRKSDMSMVRMVNVLPTMDGLSVTSDDRQVFSGVNYKDVTPYRNVEENFARFRLQAGGKDTTIATNNEIMMDGSRYTIVALPQQDGGVKLRVLKDEITPDSGKARLRVIHAVPNQGEVDIMLQGQTDPMWDNVNMGSEAGYKDVNPGSTTITVRADKGGKQLITRKMNFEAGHAYTLVLTSKGGAVEAVTIDDRAPADSTHK